MSMMLQDLTHMEIISPRPARRLVGSGALDKNNSFIPVLELMLSAAFRTTWSDYVNFLPNFRLPCIVLFFSRNDQCHMARDSSTSRTRSLPICYRSLAMQLSDSFRAHAVRRKPC